jgi:hypothetical protein
MATSGSNQAATLSGGAELTVDRIVWVAIGLIGSMFVVISAMLLIVAHVVVELREY